MKRKQLSISIVLGILALHNQVIAAEHHDQKVSLPTLSVEGTNISNVSSEETGEYKVTNSNTATKLNLSIKETPQSISILTRQQIDDYALVNINDAINLIPSINVERHETDRTWYTARGFDVTNFQLDGLGLPASYGNLDGDIDTVVYDRIEVLRGANGLLSSSGDPSATINFVRKRPTDEFKASAKGLVGSWNQYRTEIDASGSLNEENTVRGRVSAAYEDADSYLDRYSKTREVFYGVLDFELSDSSLLTIGHTYQNHEADSPLWGALPLVYSDGTLTDFDVSASSSAEWAQNNVENNNTFIELKTDLKSDWQSTIQLTRMAKQALSQYFYAYGSPDPDTGAGMGVYPNTYKTNVEDYIADAFVSGSFELGNRQHELVIGAQWAKSNFNQQVRSGDSLFSPITLDEVLAGTIEEPSYGEFSEGADWQQTERSLYTSAKLDVSDRLNIILGGRYMDYEVDGLSYGASQDRTANEFVPYLGAVIPVTKTVNLYASYAEIFTPQDETDIDRNPLDPIEGSTIEAGIKMDLNNGKAMFTTSIFRTEQDNLAIAKGVIPGTVDTYYEGEDGITSQGIELDVSGELAKGLQMMGGYTYLDVEDAEGERTKLYIPKQTFKLSTTYQLASAPKWKIGANVRWKSKTEAQAYSVEQDSYAVWGAMASYQATPKLQATLNVYNIFDEKYFNTFRWNYDQAYYGAPRSAVLSAKYDF